LAHSDAFHSEEEAALSENEVLWPVATPSNPKCEASDIVIHGENIP
jgi:hypothetical protein